MDLAESNVASSAEAAMQMPFREFLKWCSEAAAREEARAAAVKAAQRRSK